MGLNKTGKSLAGALLLAVCCGGIVPAAMATATAAVTATAAATFTATAAGTAAAGRDLVRTYCSGCHQEHAGQFERISAVRKTPEGWVMTLFRMRQVHGLVLPDEVHASIVRYLADTQGLAPTESAAGRFALEQRPNAQDIDLGPEIGVMCGRCHSLARSSLQRRDEEEWRKLAHTHVGQWPSLEYQASGRDRPWWQIASGPQPAKLAALYPFSTPAWSDWQKRPAHDLSGNWVVVGRVPGGKNFYGTARIDRDGADYKARYALTDVTGIETAGDSKAIVYTGYEWRGNAEVGGRGVREVYAVSEDGNRITGRWFDPDHAEEGGEWSAIREGGAPRILAVFPQSLRTGSSAPVTIVGTGLDVKPASLSFGHGVAVDHVQGGERVIHAQLTAAADAAPGLRGISIGGTMLVGVGVGVGGGGRGAGGSGSVGGAGDAAVAAAQFAVYAQVDQIDVIPAYGIARLGGGRIAPVTAQFEALGSTRLPGGELLGLGPVAVEWSSIPFNAEAKRTEDEKFAGYIDKRGRYLPASAGPNPAREYSGDNVGNLTVVAQARDGSRTLEGRSHLVVTVQRWNTPPIY